MIEKHDLVTVIKESKREEKTLVLVFTNNPEIITQLDVSKTIMSEYNIIEVTSNLKDCKELITNTDEAVEIDEADLRQLNFHHENVSWDEIKEIIKEMPWTELFNLREKLMRNALKFLYTSQG